MMAAALAPFFAFREIARVVGEEEFRILMLGAEREARRRIRAAARRDDRDSLGCQSLPDHRDGDVGGARGAHLRRQILIVGAGRDHDGVPGFGGLDRAAPRDLNAVPGLRPVLRVASSWN